MLDILFRVILFGLGVWMVVGVFLSAVRSFVLARSAHDPLTTLIFRTSRRLFNFRLRGAEHYEDRDRVMALYAPVTLVSTPIIWLILVWLGYTLMFIAIGIDDLRRALTLSGSSLLTLGFVNEQENYLLMMLEFSEATIGLILIAILISYLPTMYAAFSKRETLVTLLETRASSPPSASELLIRAHGIRGLPVLTELWQSWEVWFAEVEETHTSLAPLVFFRSTKPERSWVTAAGAVLDAAAIYTSSLDVPRDPSADLCIRAGYLSLRYIADFFNIPYNPDPHFPAEPVSISQAEFDEVYNQLAAAGLPMKPDREQCWEDFAGWRVNYDVVLLELAALTMAPYAPWSSDRSLPGMLRQSPGKIVGQKSKWKLANGLFKAESRK
jgi:hypothetical protein